MKLSDLEILAKKGVCQELYFIDNEIIDSDENPAPIEKVIELFIGAEFYYL